MPPSSSSHTTPPTTSTPFPPSSSALARAPPPLPQDLTLREFQLLGQMGSCHSERLPPVLRRFWDGETQLPLPGHSPWRAQHEDEFPTLEALFRTLPEHVGFDIEARRGRGRGAA